MNAPRALSALTAAALAGLSALALPDLLRESLTSGFGTPRATLEERVALAVTVEARRSGHAPDLELLPTLGRRTPPSAVVWFLGDPASAAVHNAFNQAQVLLYPRRFAALETLPADLAARLAGLGPEVHLVAYGPHAELDLAHLLEPVAAGQRFRLWRVPGPPEDE